MILYQLVRGFLALIACIIAGAIAIGLLLVCVVLAAVAGAIYVVACGAAVVYREARERFPKTPRAVR